MNYESNDYINSVKDSIEKDNEKVRAMGIDPSKLVNSIYDVLDGKKPLYEGMEFSDADASLYFCEFNPPTEWEALA